MAAVTRFGLEGYGVRRAGSFAGKTAEITVRSPVTRLGLVNQRQRVTGMENAAGRITGLANKRSRITGLPS
jgi:hypothetical protein